MADVDLTPIGVLDDAAYLLWKQVPLREMHVFAKAYPDTHAQYLARWRAERLTKETGK